MRSFFSMHYNSSYANCKIEKDEQDAKILPIVFGKLFLDTSSSISATLGHLIKSIARSPIMIKVVLTIW